MKFWPLLLLAAALVTSGIPFRSPRPSARAEAQLRNGQANEEPCSSLLHMSLSLDASRRIAKRLRGDARAESARAPGQDEGKGPRGVAKHAFEKVPKTGEHVRRSRRRLCSLQLLSNSARARRRVRLQFACAFRNLPKFEIPRHERREDEGHRGLHGTTGDPQGDSAAPRLRATRLRGSAARFCEADLGKLATDIADLEAALPDLTARVSEAWPQISKLIE